MAVKRLKTLRDWIDVEEIGFTHLSDGGVKGDFQFQFFYMESFSPPVISFSVLHKDKMILTEVIIDEIGIDEILTVIRAIADPSKAPLLAGVEWAGDVMAALLRGLEDA